MIRSKAGMGLLAVLVFCGCAGNPSSDGGFNNVVGLEQSDDAGSAASTGSGSSGSTGTNASSGAGPSGGGVSGGAPSSTSSSGGASGGNGSSDNGASSGGSNGDGGSGSSGGASGNPSGGGLLTGDAGLVDNPDIDYTVQPITLTMATFTVEPGGEVYYCQTFANPWGKQVDVKTYQLDMGPGSHHMFAFYANDATDQALEMCPLGGLQFSAFTFASQQAKSTMTYPQSVGATIPSGTGFQLMVHYLNTTASPLTSSVNLTVWIAKPGAVTNHAGAMFLNNATMTVPAGCSTGCASADTYTLTQDVTLLYGVSHMHKYGTNFVATTSTGETLYTTTQWDEPANRNYSPPISLSSGTTITWTCTDVNPTGQQLTFGESANTNVMCIFVSIFYPVMDVTNPTIGELVGFAGL